MTCGALPRPLVMDPRTSRLARLASLAALALYGVVSLRSPGDGRLLDNVDLAIHETGHLVFAPFGEFVTMLGGTLLQLLLPMAFVVHFLRRKERFGAAVCLWWVAQNCWNISVYIADARAQDLPLVGGGEHDWFYLLSALRGLENDLALARAVHGAGVLIFVASLALGLAATLVTRAPRTAGEPELDAAH
jgi:hypothetical protein